VHTLDTIYTNHAKIQNLDLRLIETEKDAYGIQSPPRQSSSSGYTLHLGVASNHIEERQMS